MLHHVKVHAFPHTPSLLSHSTPFSCRIVQVLPLHVLVNCLQSTLSDIGRVEDYESGALRQKYLLHFLYKYISR